MKFKVLFLMYLCSCLTAQNQEQNVEKRPIAILTLDAKGITQQEADILTERLRTVFVQDGRYQVVERSQMETILEEQGFQQSGCTTNECLVQAGLILGVKDMIGGSVGKIGERYAIDVRLFDVESTEIIKAVSRNVYGSVDQLLDVMSGIAAELSESHTPGFNQEGHYLREKFIVPGNDINSGIEAVGDAIEFAAEKVSESLEKGGIQTETIIDKIFDTNKDDNSEFTRGKKEGSFAAKNQEGKIIWIGLPAGLGFISAVNNGIIMGLTTGWITKAIQKKIEGEPTLSNRMLQDMKDEPLDYQDGFRKGYIKEMEKIRNRRMDAGCWAGALVGFLLL